MSDLHLKQSACDIFLPQLVVESSVEMAWAQSKLGNFDLASFIENLFSFAWICIFLSICTLHIW